MGNLKLSLYLAVVITIFMMLRFSAARSHGVRRHFQDSLENGGEFDVYERPLIGRGHRGHRNHRGRFGGHHLGHDVVHLFHKGLPLLNPTKGPAQPPLILPTHPNRGLGLHQNHNQNLAPMTNNNLPQQLPVIPETHSQIINHPVLPTHPDIGFGLHQNHNQNVAPLSNNNLPQQLTAIPETHSQLINQPVLPTQPDRGFGLHQNHNQNLAPLTNNNLPQQLQAIPETHSQIINQPVQQPQPNPNEVYPFQWNVQTPSETSINRDNLAPLPNRNLAQHLPQIPETHSQIINQPVQQPQPNPYEVNPIQWNVQTPSEIPINRHNPTITNQLPASDKPATTTPNPRLTDLLYGSNLFEEENNTNSNLRVQTVRRDAIW